MPRRASRPLGSVRHLGGDRWEMRYRGASKTAHATSSREARAALADWIREVNPERTPDTLASICRQWLNATKQRKGQRTVEEQDRIIRLHIGPSEVGKMNAGQVRAHHLEDFYRELGTVPRVYPPRQKPYVLSGGTIKHVHDVVLAALGWAQRRHKVTRNFAADVEEMPAIRRKKVAVPDTGDVRALLERVDIDEDRRFVALVALALTTGARRGELMSVRWRDITPNGLLRLRRGGVTELQGGEVLVEETHTKMVTRPVALDDATLGALYDYRAWLEQHGWATDPQCFIIPSAHPDALTPDRPSRMSAKWIRVAKGTGIRLHDLRHLVASLLLDAGIPVSEVAAQLGHRRTSTTQDIYGHLIGDRAHERASIIAGLVRPRAIETTATVPPP